MEFLIDGKNILTCRCQPGELELHSEVEFTFLIIPLSSVSPGTGCLHAHRHGYHASHLEGTSSSIRVGADSREDSAHVY